LMMRAEKEKALALCIIEHDDKTRPWHSTMSLIVYVQIINFSPKIALHFI